MVKPIEIKMPEVYQPKHSGHWVEKILYGYCRMCELPDKNIKYDKRINKN